MQPMVPPRNRFLLTAGAAFLLGCLLGGIVKAGLWPLWLLGIGIAVCALLAAKRRRLTLGIAICFCALGLLRMLPALYPAAPPSGRYEQITATVAGEAAQPAWNRITFTLCDVQLNGSAVPGKAYCSVYDYTGEFPQVFDGAKLSMQGKVYLPEGKSGRPHFDFRSWMLQKGLHFGITASGPVTVLNCPEDAPITDWVARLRKIMNAALSRTMGDGAQLAMALLFSDREGMAEQDIEAFQRLGIAHIMSVSGLHVGLLGTMLFQVLNWLRMGRSRWIILSVFLAVYCALTGFSAAATRAAVMLMLSCGAVAFKRPRDMLNNLGAAILVVLTIRPLQAFSAGFVLSVSAVLGICLIQPVLKDKCLRWLPKPERRLVTGKPFSRRNIRRVLMHLCNQAAEAFCFCLSAQLGVLLPSAYYFHQLPVYGILINVLLVPVVGVLVPLCLLALLLSPVPLLGTVSGWAAAQLGNVLLWAVRLLGRLPMATVQLSGVDSLWLAPALLTIFAVSYAVRVGVWKRLLAIAAAVAVTLAGLSLSAPPPVRYLQLSVGQADAALLYDGERTIVIDTGRDGEQVLDYLADTGKTIDVLYLTQLRADHTGGVPYLLKNGVRISRVYLPKGGASQMADEESLAVLSLLAQHGIPVSEAAAGEVHTYPSVTIRTLWPEAETLRTGQMTEERPLVLAVEMGGYIILNPSDLSGAYESIAAVPCDVLRVAQHGREDRTQTDFLARTQPALALLSCSGGDGAAVGERLQQQRIPYLRTDEAGDIMLYVQNGQLMAAPYRRR